MDGIERAADTSIYVSAAQLAQTTFLVGTGTDGVDVAAFDGTQWSNWTHFTITGLV